MKAKTKAGAPTIAYRIGQVAKLAGVGIETIRFYEREGILEEPPRRESGYRDYPAEVITRLRFVKRAQQLGFSLKEIVELLALSGNTKSDCSGVKKRAELKISEIENKIADLKRMQKVLKEVTLSCVASKPIADCPILKCFDEKSSG